MTKPLAIEHPDVADRLKRAQDRVVDLVTERIACDTVTATIALYQLASAVLQRYTAAKERRSALDFDDLIARTGSLLRASESAEWVLYKLDSALAHILVDESQDTSPEQWRIIEALAREFFSGSGAHEEARTLFAVGDEKQSIYSFQGAEAEQFARMGLHFTKAATEAGVTWRSVPLSLSFRTVEPVLNAVDIVFSDPRRTPGVRRQDTEILHRASRIGQGGLVEIWPTEAYTPPPDVDAWQPLDEEAQTSPVARLAARIAGTIRTWLDREEKLVSEDRPIRPGDILILVRKRNPFATPMTAALKMRGIAVAGADRIDLIEQIAVQDLMALGDFLTLPEDDLSLAAVLKSPLFGFDDEDLLTIAAGRKRTLWRALIDHAGDNARYSEAASALKLWRSRADFMPPYEFLATLLDKDKARVKLVGRLGSDAAEAIDELTGLALTYDDQAAPSLSGFLNWLRTGSREIKRDMEHGRNEVRVLTVHGAKGLEAPIVFLPDTCTTASASSRGGGIVTLPGLAPPETADPFLWCLKGSSKLADIAAARDEASIRETHERNRLLYVAMTRARDRLYVAGFEGKQGRAAGCWYDSITQALAPVLKPVEIDSGVTVQRLERAQTAEHEKHRVTESTAIAATPLPAWSLTPAPREPQLAVPLAPSRLAPFETDEEGETLPRQIAKEQISEPAMAPHARSKPDDVRFLRGTLTHALLQHLPTLDRNTWQEAAKAYLARRAQALSQPARASIVRETLTVLNDPEFAPIFGPHSRAEVAIVASIPRPRGSGPPLKLTGQIDRLADTGEAILIVDYKTNRPAPKNLPEVAEVYLYQLAAYRLAVQQIFPGRAVRTALLWTETAHLMKIPEDILEGYTARLWSLDPHRLDA